MDSQVNCVPSPFCMLRLDLKTDTNRVQPFTSPRDPIKSGSSLGTWCLHFSAPSGSLSLSFSIYSKLQCGSTRAGTYVLLTAVVLDLQCESGHVASVAQVLRGHKNFQKDFHSLEILCPVERRPWPPVVPACCSCECGPSVARSSGAFGTPRDLADLLLDF